MEEKVNNELVDIAVNYWSGFLKDPTSFTMDNGDSSHYVILNYLAMLGSRKYPEEGILKFEDSLRHNIKIALEDIGSNSMCLGVDYHPCITLSNCLNHAFGESGYMGKVVFPCKTTMWITNQEVSVSQGYGAATKILYPVEKK